MFALNQGEVCDLPVAQLVQADIYDASWRCRHPHQGGHRGNPLDTDR